MRKGSEKGLRQHANGEVCRNEYAYCGFSEDQLAFGELH